jgi:uncharacterized protein (TIGR00251 family)
LIDCTEQADGSITFPALVVPRSSQNCLAGEHDGALRVRVTAPPVEGAANEQLMRTLARAFGVPLRAVEILSGQTSKRKCVRVQNARREQLESLLARK